MRILVADDDESILKLLQGMLTEWGYEVVAASDGKAAWEVMRAPDAPLAAILDWNMPGMTGTEVVRKIRESERPQPPYLLLLTARDNQADILEGLLAGASDYVTKPFDYEELRARLQVGTQMVTLQSELSERVRELEEALQHVRRLQGLLPICSYCKKIRDDQNYWHGVEEYISAFSDAMFSHSICPECFEKHARPAIEQLKRRA
ncbi:MAG TPA: response regulator transcription factor [Candidatus Polarisedimenticolia bacterium]|nr:response regulator transcription factor [Candidatus Polarisedimenticolia bacterium]